MTLLALLRHAETDWSAQGRIQGRTDTALSGAGCAALAGRRVPPVQAALRVVTSPLLRCVQTAQLLGLRSAGTEARIAEMSWGDWEGRQLRALRAEHGAAMAANEARGFDFQPPGGESPRQVLERVRPWLAEVATARNGTLAVTHRGVIRVVFATACGWDMLGKPPVKLDWNALQVFRLDASGHPSVHCLNLPLDAAQGRASGP